MALRSRSSSQASPRSLWRALRRAGTRSGRRYKYSGRPLLTTALVILLLVPAGALALRSLWVSLGAADSLHRLATEQDHEQRRERSVHGAFAGTEAVRFGEGEAGIALPAPAQVGAWPPDQVGNVAQAVKRILVTARLDARTFAGDTSPYVEQVAVSARGFVGERVASPEALTYVTRLAPGVTLAAPPRVKGAFAFSEGTAGQLVVVADFVWAYALESPGAVTPSPSAAPVPGASLVVLHSVERYEWFPDKGYLPDDRGMRPGAGELYAFNVDCAQAAQGLISLPMTPQEAGEAPSLAQVLDPSTPPGRLPSSCA